MEFPLMYPVRQHLDDTAVDDVEQTLRRLLEDFAAGAKPRPGSRVAVAVGSRGTHDLKILVATTVAWLQDLGWKPYIIPAMGSHGGATGEGQREVLAGLGITEEAMGVPVVATMEVESLGRVESGAEVFFAKDALAADHLVVINRVKPHTAFRGEVESGLCKILAVGCGRQVGAANMHKYNLGNTIVPAARLILEKVPVLCGVAVTENAYGGTHSIRVVRPEDFVDSDRQMLEIAWRLLPRLPVADLDVLVVDEMGKNVSGAGMDPNVIGFWRREGGPRQPDYRTLVVLDLTPESHGNATGIGMADLTTKRVMDKIDLEATYMNALTSRVLRSARLPIALEDDRRALEVALDQTAEPSKVRMARIVNTGKLGLFWVTAPVAAELRQRPGVDVSEEPVELEFSADGRLLPFPS